MSDDVKAACDNIRLAIQGKHKFGYAEVNARDVMLVGSVILTEKSTAVTSSLVAGARAAIPKDDSECKVYQIAGQLGELLAAAGIT